MLLHVPNANYHLTILDGSNTADNVETYFVVHAHITLNMFVDMQIKELEFVIVVMETSCI